LNSDASRDESSLLIREILIHVVRHPDAKDTLDGIHKFWLSARTAQQSRHKVHDALEYLAEQKQWLTKKTAGTAVTLFGVNKDRADEIREFLNAS
jgi:hypothetical protein